MKYIFALIVLFSIGFFQTCCQKEVIYKKDITKANLSKVSWDSIDGFYDDNLDLALDVFKKDCKKSQRYKKLKQVCQKAFFSNNSKEFFTNNFTPYQLLDDKYNEDGLITGYYEPLLYGSLTKTTKYKYPIFQTPSNLLTINLGDAYPYLKGKTLRGKLVGNKVVPYTKRADLESIEKKHLQPICYVDNKIDLFFLQIQGSGKVKLENGKILNIGYSQQNGRKYYPIGRKLIELGYIKRENISLQSIKEWLENHPKRIDEFLNLNDSYVFFHLSQKSATGSLGVELVERRNLAVDRKYIPLGYPVFINTTNPIDNKPINTLMVAADTGGAIKGEIRADLFFGNSNEAKELAGKMKQKGKLFLFIPNNI